MKTQATEIGERIARRERRERVLVAVLGITLSFTLGVLFAVAWVGLLTP